VNSRTQKEKMENFFFKQTREAYRGESKRQSHSRSSQPAVPWSELSTGMACEVLAPVELLALGAEARGLARCDGLKHH
jgi:hypothetical protein